MNQTFHRSTQEMISWLGHDFRLEGIDEARTFLTLSSHTLVIPVSATEDGDEYSIDSREIQSENPFGVLAST